MPQKAKDIALSLINGNPNNQTKKELYKRKKTIKDCSFQFWMIIDYPNFFSQIILFFYNKSFFLTLSNPLYEHIYE